MNEIVVDTKFADKNGKIVIVQLKGFIDQTNSYIIQKTFDDILESGCSKIIIDFTEVMYISSAGWGIFVGEIKRFRDNGGDIKLANMTPDIYEVYQMLEFYHIFEDYNSTELAVKSFDNGKITRSDMDSNIPTGANILEEFEESIENSEEDSTNQNPVLFMDEGDGKLEIAIPEENKQSDQKRTETDVMHLSRLPVNEKIKRVIAQYPLLSPRQIKKILKDERFGETKISILKLYKILKELNLNSKEKRYRYYRSC